MNAQEREKKQAHLNNLRAAIPVYENCINSAKTAIAALEAELSTNWEPEGGSWAIYLDRQLIALSTPRPYGFATPNKARAHYEAMRPCDKLARYLIEHDDPGDWHPFFDELFGDWYARRIKGRHRDPTKQYRSERVIRELCERLNGGEVVL